MTGIEDRVVGRFSIDVELTNHDDLVLASVGHIQASEVRRMRVRGVVDTGATRLVIPSTVAKQLGLKTSGSAKVRYADGHTAQRDIAKGVHLSYGGRDSVFSAIIEPERESALVGAIVMVELDFVADCITQRLVPRDPKQIISEIE